MLATISKHDMQEWEKEIQDAESSQLQDPAAMDILGARKFSYDDRLALHDTQAHTHAEKWIQMAIDIEELQCIPCFC